MLISDWSSDVCSSDLLGIRPHRARGLQPGRGRQREGHGLCVASEARDRVDGTGFGRPPRPGPGLRGGDPAARASDGARDQPGIAAAAGRSEEHTSELQSLMRISYAVFCLQKKKTYMTRTK